VRITEGDGWHVSAFARNGTLFVDALVKRNVRFELMTYPGAKHGIGGRASQLHVFGSIEAFFKKNLAKAK
jgi:dipeptidyl-peptidase-4